MYIHHFIYSFSIICSILKSQSLYTVYYIDFFVLEGGQTKPDKAQLLEVLAPIASKWSEIGNALKVRPDVIAGLNGTASNVSKLSTILQKWQDTLCSPVTWGNLIEMLESKFTDNGNAAAQVREFLISDDAYEKYMNQD